MPSTLLRLLLLGAWPLACSNTAPGETDRRAPATQADPASQASDASTVESVGTTPNNAADAAADETAPAPSASEMASVTAPAGEGTDAPAPSLPEMNAPAPSSTADAPSEVLVNGSPALLTSLGYVRIELDVADGLFCDPAGVACNGPVGHISVHAAADGPVLMPANRPLCGPPLCDSCAAVPCPGFACLAEEATAVTDQVVSWDGGFSQAASCGPEAMTCRQMLYAPAGRYVAQACATVGNAVDGCEGGRSECVTLTFDYPSDETYTLTLMSN